MKVKNLIKMLLIGALVSTGSMAVAQQDAMFTQYMFNEVTINPAYAGSHDLISMTGLIRQQWLGIEGAPSTQSFNAHSPLRNDRLGVGLTIMNDKISVSNNVNINGAFSYKLPLNEKSDLHFGLQAGLTNNVTDLTTLDVKTPTEDVFEDGYVSKILPNFGAGFYYYTKKFYLGVSVPQIMNNSLSAGGISIAKQERHYFLNSGYVFELSPKFKLKPSLFFKFVTGAPMELDITNDIYIRDKYIIGLAWRSFDSADLLLGMQITEQLFFGYSYDYALTRLNDLTTGSHEILLNYRFSFSPDKVITPRYF